MINFSTYSCILQSKQQYCHKYVAMHFKVIIQQARDVTSCSSFKLNYSQ